MRPRGQYEESTTEGVTARTCLLFLDSAVKTSTRLDSDWLMALVSAKRSPWCITTAGTSTSGANTLPFQVLKRRELPTTSSPLPEIGTVAHCQQDHTGLVRPVLPFDGTCFRLQATTTTDRTPTLSPCADNTSHPTPLAHTRTYLQSCACSPLGSHWRQPTIA